MSSKSASCRPRQSNLTRPLTTPVMNGVFSKTSTSPRGASMTPVRPNVWPRSRATYHVLAPSSGFAQRVGRVVVVLEIGVAEHRLQHEQSLELARADEGILVVGPGAGVLEPAAEAPDPFRGSAPAAAGSARRLLGLPFLHVVDRRLVVADAPEDPRRHDFGRRLGRKLRAPLAVAGSVTV